MKTKTTLLAALALCGCIANTVVTADASVPGGAGSNNLDQALRKLIKQNGLSGLPAANRTVPDIHSPKAQLGMRLFFNKALGGDKDAACASCHHPLLGGGDDLSQAIGVQAVNPDLLGPGRTRTDGQVLVPRNSPSTFNTALWDSFMFWDGRVESLGKIPGANGAGSPIRTPSTPLNVADPNAGDNLVSAQAKFPVTSVAEMRGNFATGSENTYVWMHLGGRLGNFAEGAGELPHPEYWVKQFRQVYGTPTSKPQDVITQHNLFDAIGAYERSQLFVDTPWSHYVRGDQSAINEKAKRGALLFYRPYNQGGGNCVACHSGDKFTDENFHNLGVPQIGIGGRGGADNSNDYGRGHETGKLADRFAFRTPSLLNVQGTAPYTHSGAYLNLKDVIRHHSNPFAAVYFYDDSKIKRRNPGISTGKMRNNTLEALVRLYGDMLGNRTPLRITNLSEENVDDLAAFLRTLTDPCIKSADCLAPWIPPLGEDPNGLQLDAQFRVSADQ